MDLRGSAPFDKDTLLSARKLGFRINLKKLIFDPVVHVNKIFLTNAPMMNVQVNAKGEANYNSANGSKGVVMIPGNLNLILKAKVEKINYDGIVLDHFNGGVNISGGGIKLAQTGFNLVGALRPVYPSLTGSGVLSVKNVKFNGWKLFNTVGSKT